jgi:hypothetical protein
VTDNCRLFESVGVCRSLCSTCGRSCEAPYITRFGTLRDIELAQCDVILGTLRLEATRFNTELDYLNAFRSIESIQGDLIITGVDNIVSLRFLASLRHVNNIYLIDNTNLVDATLPELEFYDAIHVEGCPYLCRQLYPGANRNFSSINPTACGLVRELQYLKIQGADTGDVGFLSWIRPRVLPFLTPRCANEVGLTCQYDLNHV